MSLRVYVPITGGQVLALSIASDLTANCLTARLTSFGGGEPGQLTL